ncbi:MAG: hypothetical protein HY910_14495 [Desulfarculus sp.]|nr:hypothetical protein [Desulfarculus sp.]
MQLKSLLSTGLALVLIWGALGPVPCAARVLPDEYILATLPWDQGQKAVIDNLQGRGWQVATSQPGAWSGAFLMLSFACCSLATPDLSQQMMTLAASGYHQCQMFEARDSQGHRLIMFFSQASGQILTYEFHGKDIDALARYLIWDLPEQRIAQCRGESGNRGDDLILCQAPGRLVLWLGSGHNIMAVFLDHVDAHFKATGQKPITLPEPPC